MITVAAAIGIATAVYQVVAKVVDVVRSPQFQALWKEVKAFFSAKPAGPLLTPQELDQRRETLKGELLMSMHEVCPQGGAEAFAVRAVTMVDDVLTHCMRDVDQERAGGAPMLESKFSSAAVKARQLVEQHRRVEAFIEKERSEVPSIWSVQVRNPHDPQGPRLRKILVLRTALPIEYLVLRGGGAKGLGNAPALRALANLGKLSELKKVVGTSAGALTAVCLASGMSAKEFQQLSSKNDMVAMLGSPANFAQKYPNVRLGSTEGGFQALLQNMGAKAGNALETLDRSSATSVSSYLNDNWPAIEQKPQWQRLKPEQQERLKALKSQNFDIDRTDQMITFGDLKLLHRLEPGKFKELVLTGFNATKKETVYFSAETHEKLPVALAGRISMAIPVFFQPVEMRIDGKKQHFVDGGVGSNMPSEVITAGLSGEALQEANAKTLLMTYDESGRAYSIMHGNASARADAFKDWFMNASDDNRKIHAAGLNVLPVYHGELGTLSFHATAQQIEEAQTQAMLMALEHIQNVMGGGRHDLVEDVEAAARLLSVSDQDLFLAKHEASDDPLNVAMCKAIRTSRLDLTD